MKFSMACATVLALAALPAQASVDAIRAQALASQHACMGCHAADQKRVGPSYREVAARYRNDAGASAKLFRRVREGSVGVWGAIPMPANAKIREADLKTVMDWVLIGAPAR